MSPTLTSLPTEIKVQILSHLFTLPPAHRFQDPVAHRHPIRKEGPTRPYPHSNIPFPRPLVHTSILRANKELHALAMEILYARNTFTFTSTKAIEVFVEHCKSHSRPLSKQMRPSARELIRDVMLRSTWEHGVWAQWGWYVMYAGFVTDFPHVRGVDVEIDSTMAPEARAGEEEWVRELIRKGRGNREGMLRCVRGSETRLLELVGRREPGFQGLGG
ncbi:hypothetical protein MMC30_001190 [Trapelia coarctata]|nr:hypothetical protein [Trapelia coarctata]